MFPEMGQYLDIRGQMIKRNPGVLCACAKAEVKSRTSNRIPEILSKLPFAVAFRQQESTFHHPTPQCKLPCS